MLGKKGKSRYRDKKRQVIGVLGLGAGLGVTHLVLAMANFLEECRGLKVAVIECNDHHDLQALGRRLTDKNVDRFDFLGVSYFTNVEKTQISRMINMGYDAYFIDFGWWDMDIREELYWCDRRMLLGSSCPWRRNEFEICKEQISIEQFKGWEVLVSFGTEIDKKEIEAELNHTILRIPYLENPFQVARNNFAFMDNLL